MSISTDGQISYGIDIGDAGEIELPWDDDADMDADIGEWWFKIVNGYQPPFEMFDDKGDWIGGKEWPKEKSDEYYQHKWAFEKANPLPVEMVNTCSDSSPMYILAVPVTVMTANRGYPKAFDPSTLAVPDDALEAFDTFIEEHIPALKDEERSWHLSSYYG